MTEDSETTILKKVPTIVDDDKNTKLHYSAASGITDNLLKDLKDEPKVDVENYLGWTPLMMACRNGHITLVQILLDHRADATKKNRYGMSVLLVSVASGNLEVIHLILQHLLCGGVSRQSMQKLFSPLSMAVLFCHHHIVKYLVEQNFTLNIATPVTGITPLMFAAAMENCEALTLLLSKGADAAIKNCIGFTAHGIMDIRKQKVEMKRGDSKYSKHPPNLMTNSSHLQPNQSSAAPYIVISPQPSFYQLPPSPLVPPHIRKSSNTLSPSPGYYLTTPNVTPITPLNFLQPPQMFFPSEFSPSQIYGASPIPNYYSNSNDFLNARMNPNGFYLSPIPQTMNYASPCLL